MPNGHIIIQKERMKSMRRTKAELQETEKVENVKPEIIGEKRYVRLSEGAKRYSVSINSFRIMAKEARAVIHVRRIVLIDTKILEEYLEAFRED